MKNVYDYEIQNDSADQEPQAMEFREEKPPKEKKVIYDKRGNVREDRTERRIKLVGIFVFVILLQIYVAQCIAKQMGGF